MEDDEKHTEDGTLREDLSNLAHEQWSGWMEYLFEKSTKNKDGTITIPKWAVDRWERQTNTPYSKLSKQEQDSDRNEADKYLKAIKFYMGKQNEENPVDNTHHRLEGKIVKIIGSTTIPQHFLGEYGVIRKRACNNEWWVELYGDTKTTGALSHPASEKDFEVIGGIFNIQPETDSKNKEITADNIPPELEEQIMKEYAKDCFEEFQQIDRFEGKITLKDVIDIFQLNVD